MKIQTTHTKIITELRWSPDGQYIASGAQDGLICVWRADDGILITTYVGHQDHKLPSFYQVICELNWSPDSRYLLSAASNMPDIHVWNATTGQLVALYRGHTAFFSIIQDAIWSPSGNIVASTSQSMIDNCIHIWHPFTGNLVRKIKLPVFRIAMNWLSLKKLSWSPDDRYLACSTHNTVRIYDVEREQSLRIHPEQEEIIANLRWSPDGRSIASGGFREIEVWDAQTIQKHSTYSDHKGDIRNIEWSPNSRYVSASSGDKSIHVWRASNGERVARYPQHEWMAWSPDSRSIASADTQKAINILSFAVPQTEIISQSNQPFSLDISDLRLTKNQCQKLADSLIQCSCMKDSSQRDSCVRRLPDEIQYTVNRNSTAIGDVLNIVDSCNNYAGGLQQLLNAVHLHEGNSFPMQNVEQVLKAFADV